MHLKVNKRRMSSIKQKSITKEKIFTYKNGQENTPLSRKQKISVRQVKHHIYRQLSVINKNNNYALICSLI